MHGYKNWIFHGERFSSRTTQISRSHDYIDGRHDTFWNIKGETSHGEGEREELFEDAKIFFYLLDKGKKELYPGCENFSKLSFIIQLYLLKSLHGLSDIVVFDLLDLLKEAFPFALLPESFNKARKRLNDLGISYDKIHAFPNNCMLFWNENTEKDNCSMCGSSRW